MLSYQETLQAIHSHKANGRRPDFKRLNWILDKLGRPQAGFPSLHIVGTNGKGSTTALLQAIFTTAGYKTGTFTSLPLSPASMKELPLMGNLLVIKSWLRSLTWSNQGLTRSLRLNLAP